MSRLTDNVPEEDLDGVNVADDDRVEVSDEDGVTLLELVMEEVREDVRVAVGVADPEYVDDDEGDRVREADTDADALGVPENVGVTLGDAEKEGVTE
jgi:hypothetical protein